MTAQIIAFNGKTFKTKTAATEHLREFVRSLPLDTWLHPDDTRFALLLDAFDHHPTWGDSTADIRKLRVEHERGSGLAIVVVLSNGETDKVGWTRCFTAPRTDHSRIVAALRYEIAPQISDFRKRVLDGAIPQVSAISSTPLVLRGSHRFHVDHTPAFADTVEKWAKRWGGLKALEVRDLRGGGTELVSDEIADDWWDFHARRHNRRRGLRAISREENLALGRHDGKAA